MTRVSDRIKELSTRATREYSSFEPPSDPPDEERAIEYLVDGVGDAVAIYIEARTGELVRFTDSEFILLERALNDWLELYAACYGVDIDASFTVREAAELVIKTHNLRDAALLLTNVPERDRTQPWSRSV